MSPLRRLCPQSYRGRHFALALGILLTAAANAAAETPRSLAARLADLGPRPLRSDAHAQAVELLLSELRDAGLQHVEARVTSMSADLADADAFSPEGLGEVPTDSSGSDGAEAKQLILQNLTAVLPGRETGEIVLSAHYDTVPASPGAGDDASGVGTILAAVRELARTPLRHDVRLILFDGEEAGLLGSRAWVESLSQDERDRVLAVVNVEGVGWEGSAGGAVHSFPIRRSGERRVAPGWLVHAALRGGEAVDFPLHLVDPVISLPAQLLLRSSQVRLGADSDSFLAAGIPALFVSDGSFVAFDPAYHRPSDVSSRLDDARLAQWAGVVAAIVRRLDGLEGRPLDEDQYLVAAGRVWLRRDLLWLCFAVWAVLAIQSWRRSRLGKRRPTASEFAFRSLLLLAAFVSPVFAAGILLPAAVIAIRPPRSALGRRIGVAVGLLPALGLLALFAVAVRRGFVSGWALSLPATLVLAAVLASFSLSLLRRPASDLSA